MHDNAAALLRVLAATLVGRAAISLGTISAVNVKALLAGLDITSSLIVASGNDSLIRKLSAEAPEDLRFAVHVQSLAEFLDDIAAHRFGLALVTEEGLPLVSRALDMLEVGGIIIGLGRVGCFPEDPRFESVALDVDGLCWLATRRQNVRPTRRRRTPKPHA